MAPIALTPILNIYFGFWDLTILVLPALLLLQRGPVKDALKVCLATLYLIAWISQPMAALSGLQPMTLAVGWFAWLASTSESLNLHRPVKQQNPQP